MMTSINKSRREETGETGNLVFFAGLGLVLLVSLVLLVYVYTALRRPSVQEPRKVVLPPSARRRMKKKVK